MSEQNSAIPSEINGEEREAIALQLAMKDPDKFWSLNISADEFEQALLKEEAEFTPSIRTQKSRDAIASHAHKVTKARKAIDDSRKARNAATMDRQKVIDAVVEKAKTRRRKPLTDWETQDRARKDAHRAVIKKIEDMSSVSIDATSADIRQRREDLLKMDLSESELQEFASGAEKARAQTLQVLEQAYDRLIAAEEEKKELERLRAVEQERSKKSAQDQSAQPQEEQTEAKQGSAPEPATSSPTPTTTAPKARPVFGGAPPPTPVSQSGLQLSEDQKSQALEAARAISDRCGLMEAAAKKVVFAIMQNQIPFIDFKG